LSNKYSSIQALFEGAERPTNKYDTYFDTYEKLLHPYRDKDVVLVEVGVQGGGSLEVWRKYFGPKSRIVGIDLNPSVRKELGAEGFEIYIGDQASDSFWQEFYREIGMVDIVIDDGGHTNIQTATTLRNSLNYIRDGGVLIVEDIHVSYMKEFGNPSKASIVEKSKAFIDLINARSCRVYSRMKDELGIAEKVHSVQYFESIIALSIDRRLCRKSKRMFYGSEEFLSTGKVLEDYRNYSTREASGRRFLRRMVAYIRSFKG